MIILSIIGFILMTIGTIFIGSGIVGLIRFQGFYNKLHAAGVIESCGIPFCLVGLSLMQTDFSSAAKLIIIALLIFLLGPVSTHAIARAAIPYKLTEKGRLK